MNGWDLVQAEAFDTHQKKKKPRQASGIQEWPGHFKWRKNARIEKGGILEMTSIYPQNHGLLGLGFLLQWSHYTKKRETQRE